MKFSVRRGAAHIKGVGYNPLFSEHAIGNANQFGEVIANNVTIPLNINWQVRTRYVGYNPSGARNDAPSIAFR